MRRSDVGVVAIGLMLLVVSATGAASWEDALPEKPFSAEYEMRFGGGPQGGVVEVFFGNRVARVNMPMGISWIVQFRRDRALVMTLMDQAKQYTMESVPYDSKEFEIDALWMVMPKGDIGSFCANEGVECERLGTGEIAGRSAQRWMMTEYDPEEDETTETENWFDTELRLVLKSVSPGGEFGFELIEIDFGVPPAAVFEIPDGYQKMGVAQ
jgi:hypothetical protein